MIPRAQSFGALLRAYIGDDKKNLHVLAESSGIRAMTLEAWLTSPPLKVLSVSKIGKLLQILEYDHEAYAIGGVAEKCYTRWQSYGLTEQDFPESFGIATAQDLRTFLKNVHSRNVVVIAYLSKIEKFAYIRDWFYARPGEGYNVSPDLLESVMNVLPVIEWMDKGLIFNSCSSAFDLLSWFYEACEQKPLTKDSKWEAHSEAYRKWVALELSATAIRSLSLVMRNGEDVRSFKTPSTYTKLAGFLKESPVYAPRYLSLHECKTSGAVLEEFVLWMSLRTEEPSQIPDIPVPVQHIPATIISPLVEKVVAPVVRSRFDPKMLITMTHDLMNVLQILLKEVSTVNFSHVEYELQALEHAEQFDELVATLVELGRAGHPSVNLKNLASTITAQLMPQDVEYIRERYQKRRVKLIAKLGKNENGGAAHE